MGSLIKSLWAHTLYYVGTYVCTLLYAGSWSRQECEVAITLLVDCECSAGDPGLDKCWISNGNVNLSETTGTRAQWLSIVIHAGGAMRVSLSKTTGTKGEGPRSSIASHILGGVVRAGLPHITGAWGPVVVHSHSH